MSYKSFTTSYSRFFEPALKDRYIPLSKIEPLLFSLKKNASLEKIGTSVGGLAIYKIKIGNGKKKVLMWSQMHGNESTTTKSVFDLINFLDDENEVSKKIISECEIHIIPILNPDGALAYTRINKNEIDLNRDAQNLSQPESKILKKFREEIAPDFCFNLHGQRTIFNVGDMNKPATVSFLSPAEDENRTITTTRKKSMELIAVMNKLLQKHIPGQVGRYDDSFNINCVGDTFQSLGVPTILFEAGHFPGDYERDVTRKFIFYALVSALEYISVNKVNGNDFESYFDIPENGKLFYDIILRNVPVLIDEKVVLQDVGVLYKEKLKNDAIIFEPNIENIGSLHYLYAHKEYLDCDKYFTPLPKSELSNNWLIQNLRILQ
ncbi:peptidase M14 [Flavobacteriaceae bacterium R38]|nr:peptidase M14 [Flavobacteriaceae bacterium R38]